MKGYFATPHVRKEIFRMEVPSYISSGLNAALPLRPYQSEAIRRFIHVWNMTEPFDSKHWLFHMATGSGKTLIMAALMLFLYKKGYRNFVFFVHSNSILSKARCNFVDSTSPKYQFAERIIVDGRLVNVVECNSFDDASPDDINIVFRSLQKIRTDAGTTKEFSLSPEEMYGRKTCLISDEAHHLNVSTKNKKKATLDENGELESRSWESCVSDMFEPFPDNVLLEFTATLDESNADVRNKYSGKVLYDYSLKDFRREGYSKDVFLVQSDATLEERILGALTLNQYRRDMAKKHGLSLKPVILFKCGSVKEAESTKEMFLDMISSDELPEMLGRVLFSRMDENGNRLAAAFRHYEGKTKYLAAKLRLNFRPEFCIVQHSASAEKDENMELLNDMENNSVRAVFAVNMLNEGWDVLNLFDIVRCSKTKSAAETISDAQLIGRGARLFPFSLPGRAEDKFVRKYDMDVTNELRTLEELHYHSTRESDFIRNLRAALAEKGLVDNSSISVVLGLKKSFEETNIWKRGKIWLNRRRAKIYERQDAEEFFFLALAGFVHTFPSGYIQVDSAFDETVNDELADGSVLSSSSIRIGDIPENIVQHALDSCSRLPFERLSRRFPRITSFETLMSDDFLGGVEITVKGDARTLSQAAASARGRRDALGAFFERFADELDKTESVGDTVFIPRRLDEVFWNTIRMNVPASTRVANTDGFPFYAYDKIVGTSEEEALLGAMNEFAEARREDGETTALLRNEKFFRLYDFEKGRAFEPDFLLLYGRDGFLGDVGDSNSSADGTKSDGKDAQETWSGMEMVFVEAKGEHLREYDAWKETFLDEIEGRAELRGFENEFYRIRGVPFFTEGGRFRAEFMRRLDVEHSAAERDRMRKDADKRA